MLNMDPRFSLLRIINSALILLVSRFAIDKPSPTPLFSIISLFEGIWENSSKIIS